MNLTVLLTVNHSKNFNSRIEKYFIFHFDFPEKTIKKEIP